MKMTSPALVPVIALLGVASVAFAQDISKVASSPSVQAECKANPDGVAVRLLPDGGFMVFSQATGTYDDGADPDDVLLAEKEALARSKANLAKFMKESISTDDGMKSASRKVKALSSSNGVESASVDSVRVKESFETIRSHADALLRGVVVLTTEKVPGAGSAGTFRVQTGVSSKTLEAANRLSGAIDGTSAIEDDKKGAPSASGAKASGADGDGWLVCEGNGADRASAVQAALIEGISMFYGTRLESDSRLDERMQSVKAKMVATGEAPEKAAVQVNQRDVSNSVMMQTQGFVDQYRIISVEKVDGPRTHAKLRAHFYNPRQGGAVSIFIARPIMKPEDRTRVFDVGPDKRLSGADILAKIGETLVDSATAASKMVVFSENDLTVSGAKLNANIMADLTPGDELVKAGKRLLADYLFSARVEDMKYTRKMGLDKASGKFKKQQNFTLRLMVRLTDVKTGASVCSKPLVVTLQDDEIAKLQEASDDPDLLGVALGKVSETVREWAEQQFGELAQKE